MSLTQNFVAQNGWYNGTTPRTEFHECLICTCRGERGTLEGQRKIYDTFMLNHVWLDYIVLENDEIKKKIFCSPTCPDAARGGTLDRPVGQVGPSSLGWENIRKIIFF